MANNEDLMRAVRELGQEFGKIADQAGVFVREAAQHFGTKVPFIAKGDGPAADPSKTPIEAIRALGELRDNGLVTEDEFQAKKRELLARI